MHQWKLKIMCLYFFIFLFVRHSGEDSICTKRKTFKSYGGNITSYTEKHCCPHYENISGQCIACKHGFMSENGVPCTQCDSGFYGFRCARKCKCAPKRCNYIDGCMFGHSTEDLKTHQQISSTVFADISTITELTHGNAHLTIYVVCCFVLTVFIGSGVVCLKRKNKMPGTSAKRHSMKTGGTSNRELQIFPQRENMQRCEGPYAVIGE